MPFQWFSCFGPPRPKVPEQYLRPQGLYNNLNNIDLKRLRRLILHGHLAPCWAGKEACAADSEVRALVRLAWPAPSGSRRRRDMHTGLPGCVSSSSVCCTRCVTLQDGVCNSNHGMIRHVLWLHPGTDSFMQRCGALPGGTHTRLVAVATFHMPVDARHTLSLHCPVCMLQEECPICFLFYPVLNSSRCCNKRVCTECFLQVGKDP
jgi:hypothetical protein